MTKFFVKPLEQSLAALNRSINNLRNARAESFVCDTAECFDSVASCFEDVVDILNEMPSDGNTVVQEHNDNLLDCPNE